MPRKPCYWTRKLELELVEFVREKEFIWKPIGNTNHHIQQKYKAYAEFAAKLGRGFTARSVRDRWVNIRSTFNHNLRRVDRSRQTATSPNDLYVPCWPLWKPLQFLRGVARKEYEYDDYPTLSSDLRELSSLQVKEEDPTDFEDKLTIRQRGQRTDRPRRRTKPASKAKNSKCKKVINDLVNAMKPLIDMKSSQHQANQTQSYWFFGKHVTERLNVMRECDAVLARRDIMRLLSEIDNQDQMCVDDGDYVKNELDLSDL